MLLRYESLEPLMSQLGSKSAVSRFLRHGCFTPALGHSLARLAGPKSAKTGREQLQRLAHSSQTQYVLRNRQVAQLVQELP